MKTILIKNPLMCAPMTGTGPQDILDSVWRGGHIYIEGELIKSAGPQELNIVADQVIDAAQMVVLPGLINTHHHFFQTLTRNLLATQESPLFEWLLTNYEIWRGLDAKAIVVSTQTAVTELLKSGCTTTSDHLYLFPKAADPYLLDYEIEAARELGIRFQPTRGSMSLGRQAGGLPPQEVVQSEAEITADIERLLKKYHSPASGAMIRLALAPCSPFSVSTELMRLTVRLAKENGLQMHTHLAETLDEEQFCLQKFGLRPFGYLEQLGWIKENAWFAHSIHLNSAEIKALGAARAGVAHCPTSNMRLGSGIAPIKELLAAGAKVSLAVDGSASNDSSNMLAELRNALLLSRLREKEKWLNVAEIFWMATRGGAAVLGRDDIGAIAAGKCADIILIDLNRIEYAGAQHDPLAALIFCVAQRPVDYVIVNGKIVVEQGCLVTGDEQSIIAAQQSISEELLNKAAPYLNRRLHR